MCGYSCDVGTLGTGETLGSRYAALDSTSSLGGWMALRVANRILGFPSGNIDNQFGEFIRIARTFGHGPEYAAFARDGSNSN